MQSFRTELELINHSGKALVEKDIVELERKIRAFREGTIDEDRFRSLRLARGVYGQRQQGVQMIRIKLPFGRISTQQLRRIAAISDTYSNGNLHLTTRQDIQLHHISLDKTPEIWAKLEQDEITLREACGNTVRNVTASAEAGIDPNEPFDVTPYADAVFRYFLRKPFGQELGRKIKIAFSNSEKDTAVTYIHDIGFIPLINEKQQRGFKVLVGGGLGAQPFLAQTAYEFLPVDQLIPFVEATLRVFDRYGERNSRHKARIKYLINKIGVTEFLKLIEEERPALLHPVYPISTAEFDQPYNRSSSVVSSESSEDVNFVRWKQTNTYKQKQSGYFGVYIKVTLGNINSSTARSLADVIDRFAHLSDSRITINQGLLLRYVHEEELYALYQELNALDLADPGFNSVADVTSCPGTDTCNLAISNSTTTAQVFEAVIREEFPDLIYNHDINIKISGCMNSCGQHGLAEIGFHGSSFKVGQTVIPALQVVMGGGTTGNGTGRVAEKIIKIPSKRGPDVLRKVLTDVAENAAPDEQFHAYYDRRGKDYFYQLLKPLADQTALCDDDYMDWGSSEKFQTAIGVGECAGVIIDLVQTIFYEAQEKQEKSAEALSEGRYGDSIYFSYSALIHAAKGLLLDQGKHVNTHHTLIQDFETYFIVENRLPDLPSFKELALRINKEEPSPTFAVDYQQQVNAYITSIIASRVEKSVAPKQPVR
jgi:sulfite reductase (ferredoxin)